MHPNVRICLADDHPIFLEGLKKLLESGPGMEVVGEADNGRDVLDLARRLQPDILILDVSMPELDGLEIARIRLRERLPFQIILLTMHRNKAIFSEALDLGVMGYVLKESASADITKAVRATMQGDHFVSSELTNFMISRSADSKSLRNKFPGLEALTAAERRILKLIASDRTTKEIADDLDLSPRTIDSHRANICTKLGLRGSHSLLKFAFENRSKL